MSQAISILGWKDLVDILAVGIIVYNLLLIIRGTRAVQILIGIVVLIGAAAAARGLDLRSLEQLLESLLVFLPLAVVVLFQNQIRRGLATFGRNPLLGFSQQDDATADSKKIARACRTMSREKIGALLVIERDDGLRDLVEGGEPIFGKISEQLLITIFKPGTPLHDGAVVIQNSQIAAANCFLPLSSDAELSLRAGTRHRAALGISEETDALAVVVSEESGDISVARRGQLTRKITPETLENLLQEAMVPGFEMTPAEAPA